MKGFKIIDSKKQINVMVNLLLFIVFSWCPLKCDFSGKGGRSTILCFVTVAKEDSSMLVTVFGTGSETKCTLLFYTSATASFQSE